MAYRSKWGRRRRVRGLKGGFIKFLKVWQYTELALFGSCKNVKELWAYVSEKTRRENVKLSEETYRERYLRLFKEAGWIKQVKKGVYKREYDLQLILHHELLLMGGATDENKEQLKARISTIIEKIPPPVVITSY
jgi:hypothetical protein